MAYTGGFEMTTSEYILTHLQQGFLGFWESGMPALFLMIFASSSVTHAVASDFDKNALFSSNSRLRTIACHEEPLSEWLP